MPQIDLTFDEINDLISLVESKIETEEENGNQMLSAYYINISEQLKLSHQKN
jgi:hypothetical protein